MSKSRITKERREERARLASAERWRRYYLERADQLAQQVATSREAMGLPPRVEDPVALDRVARSLGDGAAA